MNCPYTMRMCSKCGEVKFLFKFKKDKGRKYGFRKECKECVSEYNKQYYQDNKEEISEKEKQYRQDNKEKISKREKQYYQDNKEKKSEYNKQYYQDNKKEILEQKKQYYQTPQGQVVLFNKRNRRRSKEKNQGNGIDAEQWLEMMKFFEWKCAYSDMSLSKEGVRTIDHIVALDNGGLNEIWNCVPMYKSYNSSKRISDMFEWYQQQEFYSIERLQKIYEWQEYAYNKWFK